MTALVRRTAKILDPRILVLRDAKVILDVDLAHLYGVPTGRLNQALKRNRRRFPKDFAFQISRAEQRILKSQSVISSGAHGGRRTTPWVFTEHGAIMAASILNTPRAIEMSVFVVRAFIRLRQLSLIHADLAVKLHRLEERVTVHDDELKQVIAALRAMLTPPPKARRGIGFGV
jgi:hypothetical protein